MEDTDTDIDIDVDVDVNKQVNPDSIKNYTDGNKNNIYLEYFKMAIGIIILCFILYHTYNKFYNNQLVDHFVEKTVKSDILDNDNNISSFNVNDEICILRKKQEEYLAQLNKNNYK